MNVTKFGLALVLGLALCPATRAAAQGARDPKPTPEAERREDGPRAGGKQPRVRPEGNDPRGPQPGGAGGRAPGGPGGGERGPGGNNPGVPGRPFEGGRGLPEGGFGPGPGMRPPGPGGAPGIGPGGMPGMRPGGFFPGHDLESMRENDPEMYKLEMADREMERQTAELSGQYRNAPKDRRDAIRKELEELIGKHFEVRQERRMLQLTRLEKELARMRDEIERRNERRGEIVGKRITDLVGEKGDLDF
jgi:hypothetical protein